MYFFYETNLSVQVRLIDENFFTDKREFGERYCDLKMVSIGRNQQASWWWDRVLAPIVKGQKKS